MAIEIVSFPFKNGDLGYLEAQYGLSIPDAVSMVLGDMNPYKPGSSKWGVYDCKCRDSFDPAPWKPHRYMIVLYSTYLYQLVGLRENIPETPISHLQIYGFL